MKKLLHERLREFASILDDDDYTFRFEDGNFTDLELNEAESLADEIERYYIPRPRFEDGEPVQFGDAVKHPYGAVDVDKAEAFRIHKSGSMSIEGENEYYVYSSSCVFQRPAPKILDADGVEIKVGDTVYVLPTGDAFVVECIENQKKHPICMMTPDRADHGTYADPKDLTHIEPDSLEKLRDDMRNNHENWETDPNAWLDYADRLTALMECDA